MRAASWLLAAALVARGASPTEGGDAAARFAAILGRADAAAPSEVAAVPGAARIWLAARSSGVLRGTEGDLTLSAEQREILRIAGPKLRAGDAVAAVRASSERSPSARLASLELLRWHASAAELDLLVELALPRPAGGTPAADERAADDAARALEDALAAVLARDLRAYDLLPHAADRAGPSRPSFVRAAGRAGDPRGLGWLAGLLEDPEVGGTALLEIERLAPRAQLEDALELARILRPLLADPGAARRTHAARALGSLGDDGAIPGLIHLLAAGGRGERRAAHAALRAVTGRSLPETPAPWVAWYQGELRWFAREAPLTILCVSSDDPAKAVSAVRTLSERGLFRRRTAAELGGLLDRHPSPPVRAEICRGLVRLGASLELDALLLALEDEEEAVRREAAAALRALP